MKKLLLASSALVGLAGAAAAEVSVSGDGRIGLRYESDVPTYNEAGVFIGEKNSWDVISRARVRFTMTGETDSGLSFGAVLRADQVPAASAGGNNSMYKGTIWISGAYGRLTAGDVDSALENAVGDLPEVGLSGLNFYNEMQYTTSDFDSEVYSESGLLYDYQIGDATLYASFMDNNYKIGGGAVQRRGDSYALGAGYTLGNYTFGIGYEKSGVFIDPVGYAYTGQTVDSATVNNLYNNDATTWGISGGTSLSGITFKAIYLATSVDGSTAPGSWSVDDYDVRQYGIGAEYDMANGVGLKGFYRKIDGDSAGAFKNEVDIWGLGADYDLGGGAVLKGGIARLSGDSFVYGQDIEKTVADFGVALNF